MPNVMICIDKQIGAECVKAAIKWKAKDFARVAAGIGMAVERGGMTPDDALASLHKWQPELFDL